MIDKVFLVIFAITIIALVMFLYEKCIKLKKLKIYEDITLSILNKDIKTRKAIEKQCNEYLEHKVINTKIINKNYLDQCNLILDTIKYINLITSIDETTPVEKQLSKIEQAIENNCTDNKEDKKTVEKKKKGDK